MIPTLRTERLVMRAFEDRDLDPYAEMTADPEVMRHLGRGPFDRAEAWHSIAFHLGHWHLRGYGHWALELAQTGEFVGRCGAYFPEGWPGLEVGWMLGRRHWGNGYATEAGRRALGYAFDTLGAKRVVSIMLPANHASARVAQRLGGRLAGTTVVASMELNVFEYDERAAASG